MTVCGRQLVEKRNVCCWASKTGLGVSDKGRHHLLLAHSMMQSEWDSQKLRPLLFEYQRHFDRDQLNFGGR